MQLLLLKYNNYYNRIIRKESSYEDYIKDRQYAIFQNKNFNPNDGVTTEHIINWTEDFEPDYCVILTEENEIDSRWFITEAVRTRGGQYKMSLKRDTVVDNYDQVIEAPCYIEKGIIKHSGSSLIYNSENFIVNEIKNKEILLKDKTGCPWLVAYLTKGTLGSQVEGTIDTDIQQEGVIDINTSIVNWKYSDYGSNTPGSFIGSLGDLIINVDLDEGEEISTDGMRYYISSEKNPRYEDYIHEQFSGLSMSEPVESEYLFHQYILDNGGYRTFIDGISSALGSFSQAEYNEILSLNGKIIKDIEGHYYRVSVIIEDLDNEVIEGDNLNDQIISYLNGFYNDAMETARPGWTAQTGNKYAYSLNLRQKQKIIITYGRAYDYEASWTLENTTSKSSTALYDIICMPYGSPFCKFNVSGVEQTPLFSKELSMAFMNSLGLAGTSEKVLDLQILPYCPIPSMVNSENEFVYTDDNGVIPLIYDSGCIGAAFVVPTENIHTEIFTSLLLERPKKFVSSETISISKTSSKIIPHYPSPLTQPTDISVSFDLSSYERILSYSVTTIHHGTTVTSALIQPDGTIRAKLHRDDGFSGLVTARLSAQVQQEYSERYIHSVVEDLKIDNETRKYRLCSPNYNGIFEFSLAKNGQNIYWFGVDMTMKPISPYIHVYPDFNGLYGGNYGDARGLICGGDFSLGIINSAWNTYEIQNKNYQNIFDRQIQNMDVMNSIAMREAKWGAVAGSISAGAAGGITGGLLSASPIGAVIGAGIGTVTSAIGGAMDVENTAMRQREMRSYAIDNYNMSLQNVKALPYSITRTSALTFNNKLFPFIEIYKCSKEEEEAFIQKMKYDGMTIGIISKIKEFMGENEPAFVKGEIIRIEDFNGDKHELEDIANEIAKGVYI